MRIRVTKRYQEGGPVTTADSLSLYNNTMDLLNYYSKKNKYVDLGSININPQYTDVTKENESTRSDFNKKLQGKLYPYTNRRYESIGNTAWNLVKGLTFGKVETDLLDSDNSFTPGDYYKKVDENKYKQRERENDIIDMEAPMALYDKRISPTKSYTFQNENDKYNGISGTNPVLGDISTFYGYDPYLIKPASMLSPAERYVRDSKLGLNKPQAQSIQQNKKPVQPVVYQAKQETPDDFDKYPQTRHDKTKEKLVSSGYDEAGNPWRSWTTPKPQPQTREAIPGFGEEQRPYDSIMMPSGQRVTKEQFINQYGMNTWNKKYGQRQLGGGTGDHLSVFPMMMQQGGTRKYGDRIPLPNERIVPSPYLRNQQILHQVDSIIHQPMPQNPGQSGPEYKDFLKENFRRNMENDSIFQIYRNFQKEYPEYNPCKSGNCKPVAQDGGSTDSQFPDQISFPEQRKNDFLKWLRHTSFDELHDQMHNNPMGYDQETLDAMKKGGGFKLNPAHAGWCTPLSNEHCTGKRRQFAINAKHHFKKQQYGGAPDLNTQNDYMKRQLMSFSAHYTNPYYGSHQKSDPYNQNTNPYHPWWDYIPNTGQKATYQPYQAPQAPQVQQTQMDPNQMQAPVTQPMDPGMQLPHNTLTDMTYNWNTPGKMERPDVADRWWANPDLINAGMAGATHVIDNLPGGAQDRLKKWQKKTTTADWWNPLNRGSRGDYDTNSGILRPDSYTSVQFPGMAGSFHYQEGGEYMIDDTEADRLRSQGYELKEI